ARKYQQGALVAMSALVFTGAQFAPHNQSTGPVFEAASRWLGGTAAKADSVAGKNKPSALTAATQKAIEALRAAVGPLSSPVALQDAVRSYFAFRTAHPDAVHNSYLYFVDYGLPST